MTEKPILFSAPMVRAILAGQKAQTRRAVKGNPVEMVRLMRKIKALDGYDEPTGEFGFCETHSRVINKHVKCPYGQPGDRLWVRETWCPANSDDGPVVLYKADTGRRYLVDESYPVDYDKFPAGKGAWTAWAGDVESGSDKAYRPSIFMPRWASRITLKVTNVRVQRLQDISEEDAKAEGVVEAPGGWWSAAEGQSGTTARAAFGILWDSINGTWDANPWVYAITFSVASAQRQDEERSDTTSNLANTGA